MSVEIALTSPELDRRFPQHLEKVEANSARRRIGPIWSDVLTGVGQNSAKLSPESNNFGMLDGVRMEFVRM